MAVYPQFDPISKAIRDGEPMIDRTSGKQPHLLSQVMLGWPFRNYVISKLKAPLQSAIEAFGKGLPIPTKQNCIQRNSHILIDIRDKFLEHEDNPGRGDLFRYAFNMLIAEYEHDPYYRYRFDWFLDQLRLSDWQPRPPNQPKECWHEKI